MFKLSLNWNFISKTTLLGGNTCLTNLYLILSFSSRLSVSSEHISQVQVKCHFFNFFCLSLQGDRVPLIKLCLIIIVYPVRLGLPRRSQYSLHRAPPRPWCPSPPWSPSRCSSPQPSSTQRLAGTSDLFWGHTYYILRDFNEKLSLCSDKEYLRINQCYCKLCERN